MKLIDISVPVNEKSPQWPGDPGIKVKPIFNHKNDGFHLTQITLHSHAGTHIDVPYHFYADGLKLKDIPLEKFFISAKVVEYSGTNHISQEFIETLDLNDVQAILFKTKNSRWWQNPNEPFHKDFIALDQSAALASVNKELTLVGIDYFSIEAYESVDHEVHQILLENNILILENLNLSDVELGNYQLVCFPLKIESDDAGLVRAVLVHEA